MRDTEDLAAWEARADAAEADLAERVHLASVVELTPAEQRAFGEERDKLAADRDALAAAYDEAAGHRDESGLGRDVLGSGRDRSARLVDDDLGSGAVDRVMAGRDRDFAASDRADSADDRRRSAAARHRAADDREQAASDRASSGQRIDALEKELVELQRALDSRQVIGQAVGLVMAQYQLDPDGAFNVLVKLSQETGFKLRQVAARLVLDATPPAGQAQRRDVRE